MKLHFTADWLRSHIEHDPDVDCDVGLPLRDAAPLERLMQEKSRHQATAGQPNSAAPEQKSAVLFKLVHQLRRKDGLSIAQLAAKIRVDAAELEQVEKDPNYVPGPRTVHQLAEFIGVSARAVGLLTAAASAQNDNLTEAVHRFAASSDDLSKLSQAERRDLNDFVKVLASIDKKNG
ncbi:helix-turn-helix domain-containing protein [Mesorhizobium sp. M0045]|uniref:helix-turn-helix domain-containing protein n=1 Tax=unclassified Mesorhizobium TaxID=325217 RepID=UPI0003D02150|nr:MULTISPECIES: helix-turn-helix transcriptional regulator [unclassified Mesorhizobium]ESZ71843.1 transcriptional regulator [Mesorhizobium sp. L103C119B0]WJI44723.1 helix-turn-helix domain-containing protein [Mesorhizobium sp. C120A]